MRSGIVAAAQRTIGNKDGKYLLLKIGSVGTTSNGCTATATTAAARTACGPVTGSKAIIKGLVFARKEKRRHARTAQDRKEKLFQW